MLLLKLASFLLCVAATPPQYGDYKPARKFYPIPKVNGDGGKLHVYYPSDAKPGEKFPLISYAHGVLGGSLDLFGYTRHFNQLASFGFIIVAPSTCNTGCHDKTKSPYTDCNSAHLEKSSPVLPGFGTWFGEQLKAIEFARNMSETSDPIFAMMDSAAGVGIAGHSMGGQATAWAAHENCTSRWNIKAAAVHHGVTATTNEKIGVPVATFGGTMDSVISMMTKDMFDKSPVLPKIWRYIEGLGSTHLEPVLEPPFENPLLATYTAAWFKMFLGQDRNNSWSNMFFSESNPDYICKSQRMKECIVKQKDAMVVV